MEVNDKVVAARCANRDVSGAPPGPKQTCSDVVNISIFFDGTGNNKDVDGDKVEAKKPSLRRWSNPAQLWRAAQLRVEDGGSNYAIYVPGVGTPFDQPAEDWVDQKLMTVQDGDIAGMGAGAGGTRRSDAGHVRVNNQLRVALSNSATKLNLSLGPYVENGKPANF